MNKPGPKPQRGWSYKGAESTASLRNGGNKRLTDEKVSRGLGIKSMIETLTVNEENFDMGPPNDAKYPNKWVEDVLPGFQRLSEDFYNICQNLCLVIMEAMEQGLELPAGSFVERCKPASSEIRYNYYPAVAKERLLQGDTQRGWPHTDFGLITLLFQDTQGGLQYEDRSRPGHFLPLNRETPGEIAVNISDTFERWSNGSISAGVHQVWLPNSPTSSSELPTRISTVFFFKAAREAMVGALPQFISPSRPCQFEDITALEHHKRMTMALLREAN